MNPQHALQEVRRRTVGVSTLGWVAQIEQARQVRRLEYAMLLSPQPSSPAPVTSATVVSTPPPTPQSGASPPQR
jgi:hypothetical protein